MIQDRILTALSNNPPLKALQLVSPTGHRLEDIHRALLGMVASNAINRTGNGYYSINTGQHHPYTSPPGEQEKPRMPPKDSANRIAGPVGETRAVIKQMMKDNPGITQRMMAGRLNMSKGTICFHVSRINAAKIVKADQQRNARKKAEFVPGEGIPLNQPQEEVDIATPAEILQQVDDVTKMMKMPVINLPILMDAELKAEICQRLSNGMSGELATHMKEVACFLLEVENMREKASE